MYYRLRNEKCAAAEICAGTGTERKKGETRISNTYTTGRARKKSAKHRKPRVDPYLNIPTDTNTSATNRCLGRKLLDLAVPGWKTVAAVPQLPGNLP